MRFEARDDSGVSITADEGARREYDEILQNILTQCVSVRRMTWSGEEFKSTGNAKRRYASFRIAREVSVNRASGRVPAGAHQWKHPSVGNPRPDTLYSGADQRRRRPSCTTTSVVSSGAERRWLRSDLVDIPKHHFALHTTVCVPAGDGFQCANGRVVVHSGGHSEFDARDSQ
jgi:hypothetical protein